MRALFLALLSLIFIGMQPVWAQVKPLDPLPPQPAGPVTSTTPTPAPTLPPAQTPTTPATQPASPPISSPQDAQKLFDTLKNLSNIKTSQQAADSAASLADQLRDVNIPGAISGLDKVIPTSTPEDLVQLGNLLGALANGDLWKGLNDAYNELAQRYNLPNLPQAEKDTLYKQMTALHDLMSGKASLTNALTLLKNDLFTKLKNAGLTSAVKALDDLINGKLEGKDAGEIFKGSDLGKLIGAEAKKANCETSPIRSVISGVAGNGSLSSSQKMVICN